MGGAEMGERGDAVGVGRVAVVSSGGDGRQLIVTFTMTLVV